MHAKQHDTFLRRDWELNPSPSGSHVPRTSVSVLAHIATREGNIHVILMKFSQLTYEEICFTFTKLRYLVFIEIFSNLNSKVSFQYKKNETVSWLIQVTSDYMQKSLDVHNVGWFRM